MNYYKVSYILSIIIFINIAFISFIHFSREFKRESFISSAVEYGEVRSDYKQKKVVNINLDVLDRVDLNYTERITKEDILAFENQVVSLLGDDKDNYAIYIKDLNSNAHWEHNSTATFKPASIYKVPLAIITLYDIDHGRFSLDDDFLITQNDKAYSFDRLAQRSGSYYLSVRELLRYLIEYSDNTAMLTLENRSEGVYALQTRLQSQLGVTGITRVPHITNAASIARFYEGIYHRQYLSEESNTHLLNLLSNTSSTFDDRIVAGVPGDIVVAHKIGNLNGVYQDSGIVYADHDYLIVILNKNESTQDAKYRISEISRLAYDLFGSK